MSRFPRRLTWWMTVFGVVLLMAGSAGTHMPEADATVRELTLLGHIGGPAMASPRRLATDCSMWPTGTRA